jgi:hypothetical protein
VAPGAFVTGALWNAGPSASNSFLTSVPLAVASQATIQSLANGTPAAITLDATQLDTDGGHSNVTNNSRYVCQVAGWYFVKAGTVFAAPNNTGNRGLQIYKNGTAYTYSWSIGPAPGTFNDPGVETSALVQLAVGDYIEVWAVQNSGGSLSTAVVSTIASSLQCMWMHT